MLIAGCISSHVGFHTRPHRVNRFAAQASGWLDAYWMGRYYGIILPPKTEDPSLLGVEERDLNLGAEPYQGPPRPELK